MTKKNILWISIIGTSIIGILAYLEKIEFYTSHLWIEPMVNVLNFIGPHLFFFPMVLFFSLITYKMHDEVFKLWVKFIYTWISLTVIFYIITPIGGGGGYVLSIDNKSLVALLMFFLFLLISIIIIISKSIALRKK